MEFDEVAASVRGIPVMTSRDGKVVYEHVRETRPEQVLEIGTAHGVSAAYIAAALDENGTGGIVSVDSTRADFRPRPADVLADAGLAHVVTLLRRPDSSYNWLLRELVADQSDSAGNCEPIYDFIFIDGSHNWTTDGLAVVLCEKLLKPGGWLLLDDLDWTYAAGSGVRPEDLSDSEITEPHMRSVFELIVKQHPSFTEFRDTGHWGWAKKDPTMPRRLHLDTSDPIGAMAARRLRALLEKGRTRVRGA